MRINKVVAGYLRVAAEDLAGARLLAQAGNRNAIYLCSQAAEKVIRAVLTTEGQHAASKRLSTNPSLDSRWSWLRKDNRQET